ncbi:retropepsin-like domain-containing protein [Paenibacillus motobuensis]|uniref:retropepsin-like domain-containing protein n=1 Tax=Paenibacillus TaxID=44249 RepID=UPI002040FCA7|nr:MULTISPECIES: retropepsin-like domain-containing protein [Paenibacillus]MCM3038775.1 retropepsin-like domain-containing protein [Paenibacillus lutimineralis]MCM3645879.1 retropepsin-like domain-containing protein [Paenibacillus motobuensis]
MKINYDGQLITTSLTITFRGKVLRIDDVIIDTGSSHTVISPDVLEKYKVSLDKNNKLNWSSYSKEYKKLGEIINIEEQINEFRMIQNEFANEIIYRILESLDGYGGLEFEVD